MKTEANLPNFKMKYKDGVMGLLYKNMKYELAAKENGLDYWACIKNGLRFIIEVNVKDDIAKASWSINKSNASDSKPEVNKLEEMPFEDALAAMKNILDNRPTLN